MKYAIKHEVGSVYWLEGESLAYAPINKDGTFDTEAGGIVDEELLADDFTFNAFNQIVTFGQIYKEVRELLK